MRRAVEPLARFIGGTATGKRILFCWVDAWTCPSNAMNVFAFEDDYAIGVLTSRAHTEWARVQSSTLRVDIRYTPTTAFGTFPWPEPDAGQCQAIAIIARELYMRRQAVCREREIGLTRLYNDLDDGAYADVADLHRKLDIAVGDAYGWSRAVTSDVDQANSLLLKLNREIANGEREYDPFGYLRQP